MARSTITVSNPILPGFNADPSIARRGDEFFIATSTFEWLPAVQFHRSTNLRDWSIAGHAVVDDTLGLRGVRASCGVWAPSLTIEPGTGRFFLAFSVMKSQSAEIFDVDNYVCTAHEVEGPWSEPVYVNSIGFDGSVFHDDDGSKWFLTLEWETRPGRQHPGWIVAQRFDPVTGDAEEPVRIHYGTTNRGCLEAPLMYKVDGTYYLMTAEGGTGYGHSVVLARSGALTGPYEPDPAGAFLSSHPEEYDARGYRDFLRPEYFNPAAPMQKAGHGSLVQAASGEWYVAHLASRPVPGTLQCILGRETNLQPVIWEDGWLRLRDGGQTPYAQFDVPGDPDAAQHPGWDFDTDFIGGLSPRLAAPRVPATPEWLTIDAGGAVLRGRDSLHSSFDVSLLATRRHGFQGYAETTLDFNPTHFRQDAGLAVYYDIDNFLYLRVTWSDEHGSRVLGLVKAGSGQGEDLVLAESPVTAGSVDLRVDFDFGHLRFSWRHAPESWKRIGDVVDGSYLSDDTIHGFTGQHIAIGVADGVGHRATARFSRLLVHYTDDSTQQ